MENIADALRLVAFFLIFIVALSISINAFGDARRTAQTVIEYTDREFDTTYIQGETTERVVKKETIIPAIYRSFKENYKIVFKFKDTSGYFLYKENGQPTCIIDGSADIANDTYKDYFITAILYGKAKVGHDEIFAVDFSRFTFNETESKYLYNYLNGKEFKEYIGIYYLDEVRFS